MNRVTQTVMTVAMVAVLFTSMVGVGAAAPASNGHGNASTDHPAQEVVCEVFNLLEDKFEDKPADAPTPPGWLDCEEERVDEEPADEEEFYNLDVVVETKDGDSLDDATVTVNNESDWGPLANGTYYIEANADGYETTTTDVTITGDDKTIVVELTPETYTLDVTVQNETGAAIDDATVTVDGESDWGTLESGTYTVVADAGGYESNSTDITVSDSNVTATIMLEEELVVGDAPIDASAEYNGDDTIITLTNTAEVSLSVEVTDITYSDEGGNIGSASIDQPNEPLAPGESVHYAVSEQVIDFVEYEEAILTIEWEVVDNDLDDSGTQTETATWAVE